MSNCVSFFIVTMLKNFVENFKEFGMVRRTEEVDGEL